MNALEYDSMEFEIQHRGFGRWYYHMKEGLDRMFDIRAWCGCRP